MAFLAIWLGTLGNVEAKSSNQLLVRNGFQAPLSDRPPRSLCRAAAEIHKHGLQGISSFGPLCDEIVPPLLLPTVVRKDQHRLALRNVNEHDC
jgi:hypothetical protein